MADMTLEAGCPVECGDAVTLKARPITVKKLTHWRYKNARWKENGVHEEVMLEGTNGELRIWDSVEAFLADVVEVTKGG